MIFASYCTMVTVEMDYGLLTQPFPSDKVDFFPYFHFSVCIFKLKRSAYHSKPEQSNRQTNARYLMTNTSFSCSLITLKKQI